MCVQVRACVAHRPKDIWDWGLMLQCSCPGNCFFHWLYSVCCKLVRCSIALFSLISCMKKIICFIVVAPLAFYLWAFPASQSHLTKYPLSFSVASNVLVSQIYNTRWLLKYGCKCVSTFYSADITCNFVPLKLALCFLLFFFFSNWWPAFGIGYK